MTLLSILVSSSFLSTTEDLNICFASHFCFLLDTKRVLNIVVGPQFFLLSHQYACMLFQWGEISRPRRHLWCIFLWDLSDWVLVSLQRPVQWTMVAVIAHVMIQWQESAAAVPLASLYSQTARPAKVKHCPHFQAAFKLHLSSCHQINVCLLSPPGDHRNYY